MVRECLSPKVLKAAVKRMYELGLCEQSIIKVFAVYDSGSIVKTLTHYKYVSVKIPEIFFMKRLRENAMWDKRDRRTILAEALTKAVEGAYA